MTPEYEIWMRNRVIENMPKQEQTSTSTMQDRLRKPHSELELLQEHTRKEMTKWGRERSNFNHLMHLEKLKVDEKDGQLKSLEKEKENLKRNL
ncbi:hypothetical protein V6N13_065565 [Hibiscus sabdariffa]|uniref:Uncharacterized protein n=1 Tax=Hibiscus sabdariffa TaxID=183260 RepID=A0ABR2QQL9_9ROSI